MGFDLIYHLIGIFCVLLEMSYFLNDFLRDFECFFNLVTEFLLVAN